MSFHASIVDRNGDFAETGFDPDLKMMPSADTIIVGCVDPRVDPAFVLGLEQGEAAVIRNVGGRVNPALIETLGVLRVVAQANGRHGTGNLILLHHTDCGIIGCYHHAPEVLAHYLGVERKELEGLAIIDPYKAVMIDVAKLRSVERLPDNLIVAGLVYDVATGKVETILSPAPLRQPD